MIPLMSFVAEKNLKVLSVEVDSDCLMTILINVLPANSREAMSMISTF
jgi:hypothetical protein